MYQNYPEEEMTLAVDTEKRQTQEEPGSEVEDDDSTDRQYNLPPVAVPVPHPLNKPSTETTKLLSTAHSSHTSLNSQEPVPSTSASVNVKCHKNLSTVIRDDFVVELARLIKIDQVFIKEEVQASEDGFKTLKVMDAHGHRLFTAQVNIRGCCNRSLTMAFKNQHDLVLEIKNGPTSCCSICPCQCFGQVDVQIEWKEANQIGRIQQNPSFCTLFTSRLKYRILNSSNQTLFKVVGSKYSNLSCLGNCLRESEFSIETRNEGQKKEVGKITLEQWPHQQDITKNVPTVTFPKEFHTSDKILLICMCILLDLNYFKI